MDSIGLRSVGHQSWEFTIDGKTHTYDGGIDAAISWAARLVNKDAEVPLTPKPVNEARFAHIPTEEVTFTNGKTGTVFVTKPKAPPVTPKPKPIVFEPKQRKLVEAKPNPYASCRMTESAGKSIDDL